MADLSVFSRYKGFNDYQDEARKSGLAEALSMAQIMGAQVAAAKALKPEALDLDKIGEVAFAKITQGIPLSPLENAGALYIKNKSGGVITDAFGNQMQKPDIFQGINFTGAQQPSPSPMAAPSPANGAPSPKITRNSPAPVFNQPPDIGGGGDFLADTSPTNLTPEGGPDEWEQAYKAERARLAALGNKNAVGALDTAYAKSKIEMNVDQSKNAGFADRLIASSPLIKKYTSAGTDNANVRLDKNLPDFISNRVVSDDYQSFNQAQRDFINAQLRRESGAVISPGEFTNAAQQYFPQVGDSEQVLAQKENNRLNAVNAMKRSAGPAYKPIKVSPIEAKGKAAFEAKKSGIKEGATATNPATGQKITFRNGQWQ